MVLLKLGRKAQQGKTKSSVGEQTRRSEYAGQPRS